MFTPVNCFPFYSTNAQRILHFHTELYTRSSFNYFFNAGTAAVNRPPPGSDDVDFSCDGIYFYEFIKPCKLTKADIINSRYRTLLADGDDAIEVNESFTDEQDFDGNKSNSDWPLFDHVRSQDIRLLKTLNVGTIVDFMVEKKKVKFGLK